MLLVLGYSDGFWNACLMARVVFVRKLCILICSFLIVSDWSLHRLGHIDFFHTNFCILHALKILEMWCEAIC